MDMLMLLGYVEAADIETAILALQSKLDDIKELRSSANGDSATALRSREDEVRRSLQHLRDRQVASREDPQGARTRALLQRLPPRQIPRRPQALRVEPAATITRPPTADIIIQSSAPVGRLRSNPPPSSSISDAVAPEAPAQPKPLAKSSSRTGNIFSEGIRLIVKLFTTGSISQGPPAKAQGDAPSQTAHSVSSTKSEATYAMAKLAPSATLSKPDIDEELATKSSTAGEDEESEASDPQLSETLSRDERAGSMFKFKVPKSSNKNGPSKSASKNKATVAEARKAGSPAIEESKSKSCPIGVEDVDSLAKLPCNHGYCSTCLQRIFENACIFESQFPPICCKDNIELEQVKHFLTPKLIQLFGTKEVEFGTKDRTYCSNMTCIAFIHPESIDGQNGTCGKCKTKTCTLCKASSHKGDCPLDYAPQQVIRLAEGLGWQRCHKCKTMVSIIDGCNQMVCKCKAVWCYQCGTLYENNRRRCRCHHATEATLLARANRSNDVADLDALEQQQADCVHPSGWAFNRGAGTCQQCYHVMPEFTYRCLECRVAFCRRCSTGVWF